MNVNKLKKPALSVLAIYMVCFVFRFIEYFFIQTDRTFWGEAFLHKLAGIAVLCIALRVFSLRAQEVGFTKGGILKRILQGLAFGLAIFAIAYSVEFAIISAQGGQPSLQLYVSSYAVDGNVGNQTGLLFFAICIVGNIINVLMEEGVFRGLFQKLLEQKYKFITSAVIAALLFGLWHVVAPIRQFADGGSMGSMIGNIVMLVISSTLVGFQFALMTRLTGSLYMAMGAHFVNNIIVNILHVVSATGADELMVLRVAIAQVILFVVVLAVYLGRKRNSKVKSS